jgi:Arc/MetJ-type ribon-helix-helix transcriptional regulator
MKAVTIKISVNPELAEFARTDSEARAFDSMSEYMRDLIRHRRQRQIEADVAILEKAIEGAPLGDPSDKEMAEIYADIKTRPVSNSFQSRPTSRSMMRISSC